MNSFAAYCDAAQMHTYFAVIRAGLVDTVRIHQLVCIQIQGFIFRRWRTLQPPIGPLAKATRLRGGDVPLWDNGTLIGSITGGTSLDATLSVSTKENTLNTFNKDFGIVGTKDKRANLLFKGGKVRSRGGRDGSAHNLAIALDKETRHYASPRDDPRDLGFIPKKGGGPGGILFDKSRGKGPIHALWWLTPEVDIKGRDPMPTVQEAIPILWKVSIWYLETLVHGLDVRNGTGPRG